jgi:aryl-alcohol dehydrogenase-like predicted oxidoreductase
MKSFELLRDEGKFDYIGMSECSADTLRRAAKVSSCARRRHRDHGPNQNSSGCSRERRRDRDQSLLLRAGDQERSVPLTARGDNNAHAVAVIAACAELKIPIFAYSPVARGIITSTPLSLDNMAGWSSYVSRSICVLTAWQRTTAGEHSHASSRMHTSTTSKSSM